MYTNHTQVSRFGNLLLLLLLLKSWKNSSAQFSNVYYLLALAQNILWQAFDKTLPF